jgi:hypothetical protein
MRDALWMMVIAAVLAAWSAERYQWTKQSISYNDELSKLKDQINYGGPFGGPFISGKTWVPVEETEREPPLAPPFPLLGN